MKIEPVAAMLPIHSAFDSTNGDNRTEHGVHRYKYAIRAGFRVVSFLSVLAVFSVYNYLQSADISSQDRQANETSRVVAPVGVETEIAALSQDRQANTTSRVRVKTINYREYQWGELTNENKKAAENLGYTTNLWSSGKPPPVYSLSWENLAEQERAAATTLGYRESNWKGELLQNSPYHWWGSIKIVHVINLYSPLDETQNNVLESMHEAIRKEGAQDVTLIAAVHPKDVHIVPYFFDGYYTLNKFYDGRLPIFQEILDGALIARSDFDFLIYTNADIILDPDFYCSVKNILRDAPYDVVTIDRKTIPKNTTMDQIFKREIPGKIRQHPGTDCFIIAREVVKKVNTGNSFIGAYGFANGVMIQMYYFASHTKRFRSLEMNGTYHIGNDGNWRRDQSFRTHNRNSIFSIVCGVRNRYSYYCAKPKNPMLERYCQSLKGKLVGTSQKTQDKYLKYNETNENVAAWCKAQPSSIESFFETLE